MSHLPKNPPPPPPLPLFQRLACHTTDMAGRSITFAIAGTVIVIWGILGPMFHYSDTWQLVINTGTTIVTFLMVFLLQNSQNRAERAIQLKLDELIRVIHAARNELVSIEDQPEEMLVKYKSTVRKAPRKNGKTGPK